MPYKEKPIEKIYFSIGEVAERFEVSTSLIRFWETEFDNLKPGKNRKGDRVFTQKDIAAVELIHHLVKIKGFTLKGARQELKSNRKRIESQVRAIQTLTEIRSFLVELKKLS